MKCNVPVILALLLVAPAALADEASKTAKAEEFLKVSKMDEILEKSMKIAMDSIKSGSLQQLLGASAPPPEVRKMIEELQEKTTVLLFNALSWEKLKPEYARLYTETYSEVELDGLIAFYKSPAGQALVAKSPGVMLKANEIAQRRMRAVQPQLQALMQEFSERIKEAAKRTP